MPDMPQEGRAAEGEEQKFIPWVPEESIRELDIGTVRFSRGFLRADPAYWFPELASHWQPIFHSLGLTAHLVSVQAGLDFPDNLDRVIPLELSGEPAVLGMDEASAECFAQNIVPEAQGASREAILEYLERRLASSLSESWRGGAPFEIFYSPEGTKEAIEVTGNVSLTLELGGQPATLCIGLGTSATELLDQSWKENLEREESQLTDTLERVHILLSELAVPPVDLIDYIRSGTVIDLEVSDSTEVLLMRKGEIWRFGRLCQFNKRFAVEIVEEGPGRAQIPSDTTQVQVILASVEVEQQAFAEYEQDGAVLLTGTPVSNRATLMIGGEHVAEAVVGELKGSYALSILSK